MSETQRIIEQRVLGAILNSPEKMIEAARFLHDGMFTQEEHAAVFSEMLKLHAGERLPTLLNVSPRLGDTVNGRSTHALLSAVSVAAENEEYLPFDDYVSSIADRWKRAEIQRIGSESGKSAEDTGKSVDKLIADAIASLEGLAGLNGPGKPVSLTQSLLKHIDKVAQAYQGSNPSGFSVGLDFMDYLTGPWCRGQEIIIGASTKVGKSSLAMQCAVGLARFGPVLYYSGEMKGEQLGSREIARLTRIGTARQRLGRVNESEFEEMVKAVEAMESIADNLHTISRKQSMTELFNEARAFKRENGLLAVFVDHLGILRPEKGARQNSDWSIAQEAAPILKEMAEELDCIGVGLSQLNKDNPGFGLNKISERIKACKRKPNAYDLKGAIANDADHVLMPYRPEANLSKIEPAPNTEDHLAWEDAMSEAKNEVEVILALSRESRWPKSKRVSWDGQTTSFKDIQQEQADFGVY